MHVRSAAEPRGWRASCPVTLLVFDLLRLDGATSPASRWHRRRELLESARAGAATLAGAGRRTTTARCCCDATDAAGARGDRQQAAVPRATSSASAAQDWLKFPHRRRESYVVGGWRAETGSERPARRPARGRARPPTGWSTAAVSAAGSPARRGAMLQELLDAARPGRPARSPTTVPRVDALGTHVGRAGARRRRRALGLTAAAAAAAAVVPGRPHRPDPGGSPMKHDRDRRLLLGLGLGLVGLLGPGARRLGRSRTASPSG